MKSTIFSLLPVAGLAVAESVCTQKTVTTTAYETVYETASAVNVADLTSSKSGVCSARSTVTTTTVEKVYVTVTPDAAATPEAAEESTSTSTLDIYTTVTVRPSGGYFGNSTTPTMFKPDVSSSSAVAYPTMSVLPTTKVDYASLVYSGLPQSEAAKSYEAAVSSAAAKPTSKSAAPAASSSYTAAAPVASEAATSAPGSKRGEATFYGGNTSGGMCSFTGYTIPSGIFGTALSDSNWDNGANCGACVSVTGPDGNKIKAMVVDQCPGCGPNHLDLYPEAFAKLAEPSKGVINVSWDVVSCGITSPIVLKNKEGTSKFWFAMQVMNSNVPVSKLEVSTDGGSSWKSTTRKEYNYFENPAGFGADTVDVKVTSDSGESIVVKGVSIAPTTTKTAGSNFA
ncbi:carbohydrate-binding module family 63 protein [Stemphylium lycopersici]|nr:carbohydrate-binding module family 63 protein [Stemphylium lycopersici]